MKNIVRLCFIFSDRTNCTCCGMSQPAHLDWWWCCELLTGPWYSEYLIPHQWTAGSGNVWELQYWWTVLPRRQHLCWCQVSEAYFYMYRSLACWVIKQLAILILLLEEKQSVLWNILKLTRIQFVHVYLDYSCNIFSTQFVWGCLLYLIWNLATKIWLRGVAELPRQTSKSRVKSYLVFFFAFLSDVAASIFGMSFLPSVCPSIHLSVKLKKKNLYNPPVLNSKAFESVILEDSKG